MPFRLLPLFLLALLVSTLLAQEPAPPRVSVPMFPNATCPVMGKKVSTPLFADTDRGRIYVCCKPCIKKVLADVDAAYATAYPTARVAANQRCPVSGEPLGEHRVVLELQGVRFALCCTGCADAARRDSQITLARVHAEGLVDIANTTCPVDGRPVEANAFVVVGDAIVRLSSARHESEMAKAPKVLLERAQAIRAAAPRPAAHRHQPLPAPKDERASPARGK